MKEYKANLIKFSLKTEKSDFKKVQISSSKDAAAYARSFYFDDLEIYESVFLILLNQSNATIGYAKISQGGISSTVIDPVIVLKYAVDSLARSIILVHNHPSGICKPSHQDISITKNIREACKFIDVQVLDHIIIGAENNYYSFADNGI